jgi:RNA polymerase sigma factor (sigma-70 family)
MGGGPGRLTGCLRTSEYHSHQATTPPSTRGQSSGQSAINTASCHGVQPAVLGRSGRDDARDPLRADCERAGLTVEQAALRLSVSFAYAGRIERRPNQGVRAIRKHLRAPVHPCTVRAEGEVVPFPSGRVEAWARFDTFFQEQHERLFKALYFVTGNRHDAEELMQDAFLRLWERWDQIGSIEDPTGYLFRVALNGFRMRRRRAAMAVRKVIPVPERRDLFLDAEMRADVRQLLLEVTPRQRAALVLVDLLGYPAEQAARILRVRPSTVRTLATNGRRALRAAEGAQDA